MSRAGRWIALTVGLVSTVVVYAGWLAPLEAVLQARGHGIVALELAWTPDSFARIVSDWGREGVEAARQQIWRDHAFIPSYVLTFWAALTLAAPGARPVIARWAIRMAWVMPIAGLLDVIENVSLLRALDGAATSVTVSLASVCATMKFAVIVIAALALLTAQLRRRQRPS